MGLIDEIIQGEIVSPRGFANVQERDYGLLYYTTDIPDSYDGNHACILHPRDIKEAVADAEGFYRTKGLVPRVYHISQPGGGRRLRAALQAAGYQFEDQDNLFYVHRRASRIVPNAELSVRRVQSPLPELLSIFEQSDGVRAMKVIRRSLECPDFHLLVGFLDGRPVAMAAVERAGPVACVDDVLTHKPCRGRGYCRAVINELVRYHSRVVGGVLYLYTDNPTAARIYEEAGFEKLQGAIECWSAWLPRPARC